MKDQQYLFIFQSPEALFLHSKCFSIARSNRRANMTQWQVFLWYFWKRNDFRSFQIAPSPSLSWMWILKVFLFAVAQVTARRSLFLETVWSFFVESPLRLLWAYWPDLQCWAERHWGWKHWTSCSVCLRTLKQGFSLDTSTEAWGRSTQPGRPVGKDTQHTCMRVATVCVCVCAYYAVCAHTHTHTSEQE